MAPPQQNQHQLQEQQQQQDEEDTEDNPASSNSTSIQDSYHQQQNRIANKKVIEDVAISTSGSCSTSSSYITPQPRTNTINTITRIYPLSEFPDLKQLEESRPYPALSVPAQLVSQIRKQFTHILLHKPKFKTIFPDNDDHHHDNEEDANKNCSNDHNDRISSTKNSHTKRMIVLLQQQQSASGATDATSSTKEEHQNNKSSSSTSTVWDDPILQEWMRQFEENNDCTSTLSSSSPSELVVQKRLVMVQFTYDDFTVEEVLRKVLPSTITEIPSSFEIVGNLAHVNLRDEMIPYKYWVGKVILDKNSPRIRTVVNKVGNIDTEFRTFTMEVIAGYNEIGWSKVLVKEEHCSFHLDFQSVYWNSRLAGEHKRLVQLIRQDATIQIPTTLTTKGIISSSNIHINDDNNNSNTIRKEIVVLDLMAGVGPFAIPLTSTTVTSTSVSSSKSSSTLLPIHVYANDLNPVSYHYLQMNAQYNKCINLRCCNRDARSFIQQLDDIIPNNQSIDHIIMNLPGSAPEFLNAFSTWDRSYLPRIHVHCFAPKKSSTSQTRDVVPPSNHGKPIKKKLEKNEKLVGTELDEQYELAINRCELALGRAIERDRDKISIHIVRDVSPSKNMLCISFQLPPPSDQNNVDNKDDTHLVTPLISHPSKGVEHDGGDHKRYKTDKNDEM